MFEEVIIRQLTLLTTAHCFMPFTRITYISNANHSFLFSFFLVKIDVKIRRWTSGFAGLISLYRTSIYQFILSLFLSQPLFLPPSTRKTFGSSRKKREKMKRRRHRLCALMRNGVRRYGGTLNSNSKNVSHLALPLFVLCPPAILRISPTFDKCDGRIPV